jgi:hypothetical protein
VNQLFIESPPAFTEDQRPPPLDASTPPKAKKHSKPTGSELDSRPDPNEGHACHKYFHYQEPQALAGHSVLNMFVFEIVKYSLVGK